MVRTRSFPSSKWQVRIFGAIVNPAAGFVPVDCTDLLQGGAVGPQFVGHRRSPFRLAPVLRGVLSEVKRPRQLEEENAELKADALLAIFRFPPALVRNLLVLPPHHAEAGTVPEVMKKLRGGVDHVIMSAIWESLEFLAEVGKPGSVGR